MKYQLYKKVDDKLVSIRVFDSLLTIKFYTIDKIEYTINYIKENRQSPVSNEILMTMFAIQNDFATFDDYKLFYKEFFDQELKEVDQ